VWRSVVDALTPSHAQAFTGMKPRTETSRTLVFKHNATAAHLSEKPRQNWLAPCCIDRHQEEEKWNRAREKKLTKSTKQNSSNAQCLTLMK
jgi:hypothetical protein